MKLTHHRFKFLSAKLGGDRKSGLAFFKDGKHPAGQPAAAVVINPAIGLAELLGGRHCTALNPHRLKAEAPGALATELLVFRHIYKLAQHSLSCKMEKVEG